MGHCPPPHQPLFATTAAAPPSSEERLKRVDHGIAKAELVGIGFTVVFALGAGTVGGYLIKLAGAKSTACVDDEFVAGSPVEGQAADNDESLVGVSSPVA